MARIVCLGEGMLELSRESENWRMGFGGDTLNTAVHLARAGHDVAFMTALGDCPFSMDLRARWEAEGLDCSLIATHPSRRPGLYAIALDDKGERTFTYWRDSSAARVLFDVRGIDEAIARAETADLFYFSLISLAILPDTGRRRLLDLASRVRVNGGKVAFDGNFRPGLWENKVVARDWRDAAISASIIGLPTMEDEAALAGLDCARGVAAYWNAQGCEEVIVKLGGEGCLMPDGTSCPVPQMLVPVDTSGAGDAFNGGYLAARMNGASIDDAACIGHALAGWTVMRRGAIPPRDGTAPY